MLAACDLAAGELQDLAVLTASGDFSATLVALNWGLHFPLGKVFVKSYVGRAVTCSSWKLSVVTASAQDFYWPYFMRGVFLLVVTAVGPTPAHLQRSPALSPPKLCSSTERTGHSARFSKARGDEWIALYSVHEESEVMVMVLCVGEFIINCVISTSMLSLWCTKWPHFSNAKHSISGLQNTSGFWLSLNLFCCVCAQHSFPLKTGF